MMEELESSVVVRTMRASDIDACVSIERVCYPQSVCEEEAFFKHACRDARGCAVVIADDEVVGYIVSFPIALHKCPMVLAQLDKTPPTDSGVDDSEQSVYLHDAAVRPSHRGQRPDGTRVSTSLYNFVATLAESVCAKSISLTAVFGAETFWSKKGFVPVPDSDLQPDAKQRLLSYPTECNTCFMIKRL